MLRRIGRIPYIRLCTWATGGIACLVAVFALVATSSENIIYEDLTCEELVHSYNFNSEVLVTIIQHYDNCLNYVDPELDGHPYGKLTCEYVKEHALFVQGIVNDLAAVFSIKCAEK